MKVLDRYVVRELLVPILYSALTLIFLILIADLFDNLDDFLRNHISFSIILRYYLSLVPRAFIQIIPWSSWLGALFLLVNFGFHNEIVAMKAAGLKITTIVKPVLFVGFLIGIAAFIVNDRLVPRAFRTASELREVYIEKKKDKAAQKVFKNVTYYSGGDRLYYFRSFSKKAGEVEGTVVLWIDPEGQNTRQKMVAKSGVWKNGVWEFQGVNEYQMDARGRILGEPRIYPVRAYPEFTFTPSELAIASSESTFLSYGELKKTIAKLKENGVTVTSERVDLYERLAMPWQGLIMMMVSIPLLARTANRKIIAVSVLACVGIIFAYHVAGALGLAMGKAGKIFPFASAWGGNILFALGALFTLEKANY